MPALEPYAKARRHPILENLQPEQPVAGVNTPEPPHGEHACDCGRRRGRGEGARRR